MLLVIAQPYPNHNGGMIAFDADGMLLIGMGDGGSGGDPEGNGQDPDALLGKMLRIDVDGAEPYAIPADNPFADGADPAPEIWALGAAQPVALLRGPRHRRPLDRRRGPGRLGGGRRAAGRDRRREPGLEHDGRRRLLRRRA